MSSCVDPLSGAALDCTDPSAILNDATYGGGSTYTDPFYSNFFSDSSGSVPGSSTIPSSGTTISGGASSAPSSPFGNWSAILSGLGNLAGGIAGAVRTAALPTTGSISPTATAATPYPVTVNGQTVGWSSVPQTPVQTGTGFNLSSLTSGNGLIILLIAVIGFVALGRSRL